MKLEQALLHFVPIINPNSGNNCQQRNVNFAQNNFCECQEISVQHAKMYVKER